jgi:hypothetical protein
MHPRRRERLAHLVARWRPAPSSHPDQAAEADANTLRSSGIVNLGQLLTRTQCDELIAYFRTREVYDPYRSDRRFRPDSTERDPHSHIVHHLPEDVLRAPFLLSIANDPRIVAVVSRFLGCKPTIAYMAAWWSYPTPVGPQQAEFFHRDVDDWRFAKLFVYLTDVTAINGPHIYVKNSSQSHLLGQIGRFRDEDVRKNFGDANILEMCAPAGSAFLEDTYGIHKGQPVASGTRLMFQAVYGISMIPYGPKKPVAAREDLPVRELDPWLNRVYVKPA